MSRCFLPARLIPELIDEAKRWAPLETGGVLLGVCDSRDVWIEEIIGPGPNATHRKGTFVPDAEFQEARIADAYVRSGRKISYLGDWHTHPDQIPYMSRRDKSTLRSIAKWPSARQSSPIMAVLGHVQDWDAGVWRYEPERLWWKREQIIPLEIVLSPETQHDKLVAFD